MDYNYRTYELKFTVFVSIYVISYDRLQKYKSATTKEKICSQFIKCNKLHIRKI